MRLWSLHPQYMDAKGIVALWREALLAQKVLQGKTKGYRYHPQLLRFKQSRSPLCAISLYLHGVWEEAHLRGYHFDRKKIGKKPARMKIRVTRGQLEYERVWLCRKLKMRDVQRYHRFKRQTRLKAHPLFLEKPGLVEPWERIPKITK